MVSPALVVYSPTPEFEELYHGGSIQSDVRVYAVEAGSSSQKAMRPTTALKKKMV